ncbi:hypothetical protein L6452_40468 [Arctium lappa]|uniref:Uncharacterized protein n=1 Tax=Arctium lappa TaxID=4217 RepID=A0ACB8XLE7_ARCLA|nr:hypothetical protein L6452_40468 [Arctium lappa]
MAHLLGIDGYNPPRHTLRPIPELINRFPAMRKLGDSSKTVVIFPDILKLQDPITYPRLKVQKRRRAYELPSNMTNSQDLDLNLKQSFSVAKGLPEKRRQGSPSMNFEDSVTMTRLHGRFEEYSC